MTRVRTYSELQHLLSLEERFHYLSLSSVVGDRTFGSERWLNQQFYTSREWRQIRDGVIVRDNGCDLGIDGYEIHGRIIIHHMNPVTVEDIRSGSDTIFDPRYLITTTHKTHNAIHYGDERLLPKPPIERRPGDTTLWRRRP